MTWFEPFTSLLEWELPYAKWYGGGKVNVTYNCLDRHVEAGLGDRVAYYYEGEPTGTTPSARRSRTSSCSTRSSAPRTA